MAKNVLLLSIKTIRKHYAQKNIMATEKKSNRTIYAENREKYYNEVISMFEDGMTAKEIVKVVPIGKSTVYRWYDEYVAANRDANVRKSPKEAADTIKRMRSRIEQLEALTSVSGDCIVLDKKCLVALKSEIDEISTDFALISEKLASLAQRLTEKI